MLAPAAALWRRLDTPGHDACWAEFLEGDWTLTGTAIFRHPSGPAVLAYGVRSDVHLNTVSGFVRGRLGATTVAFEIARDGPAWTLNGRVLAGLEHLTQLDLSFTPATNCLQLQRMDVLQHQSARLPVAWLNIDDGTLSELAQVYERRGEGAFWYRAPSVGYEGLLEVAANSFVRRYPGLWEAEDPS